MVPAPQRSTRNFPLICVVIFSIPDQTTLLHPSCVLNPRPEWVLFNESVLTTGAYIRTVTEIRPEWLLELAANYYDLASFPRGKGKQALLRVLMKQIGKDNKAAGSNKLPKRQVRTR
jgi:pre-mRNA-splicing factor ATP-dependent RNA helicase DHX15/PRP43